MIRPRADIMTWGEKTEEIPINESTGFPIHILGEIPTGDVPMFSYSDDHGNVMRYYDYMCPECNIVLIYGEKIDKNT